MKCTIGMRRFTWLALALLAACSSAPLRPPSATVVHGQSRWIPVTWDSLPGWRDDRLQQAWPALLRSCERPAPVWIDACREARAHAWRTDEQVRAWLVQHLRPYRVETLQGEATGLATGYFEPLVDARRHPDATYRYPLYAVPADLATRRPYWTRREIETLAAARARLHGLELAYVADPLDALVLQVQGSGRLHIAEPGERARTTRLAYGGDNGQAYHSVGRWLIDQGELPAGQASWPAIREWARRHPGRVDEMLWSNPRYVFFREEPIPDASLGPRGAQGVALTPGRSIAVDPKNIPYGAPVWLDTSDPLTNQPLRRLVVAQDTGNAIIGAVRADYFWGWDAVAASQAGRMRQPLRLWVLWPATSADGR